MLGLFGMMIILAIMALLGGFLLPALSGARRGDRLMLYIALVLAFVGIVLLFVARLPLYRQRRFFTLGPGALDQKHRRIYWWAYIFISSGAVLLVVLYLMAR